ncbi:MAG TPA: hypothetical protein VGQ41_25915 [Pyrinomonadaceae bacterium]|nr:hypothetical protein [Pyrinomonadaceae bacterium]
MVKKMLLLIMLSFSLAIGSFWVLKAQDPAKPKPEPTKAQDPATPKPEPTKAQPQTPATTTEQIDLSGTYAGTFKCEPAGLVGDTTLTITGNEFTTADGKTGRITASKTKAYTSVALQVNGADPSAPSAIISLRAKKSGQKLTLMPIAGATKECSFAPAKAVAKTKQTPAAKGTEVANPAAMPAQTPSPSPEASPTPSPTPAPSPSGSPRPTPRPAPSPSPTPSEPAPSPTPSPSPSPSPSPRMV